MELSEDAWRQLLRAYPPQAPLLEVMAHLETYEKSNSDAVRVACTDYREYVIKGYNAGRVPFNEQVVASIGRVIGVPIPETAIALLTSELQREERQLSKLLPGPVHASLFDPELTGRMGLEYADEPENRERLARISVLYTWAEANDSQFFYKKQEPRVIFTIDHGWFFPDGPSWTVNSLRNATHIRDMHYVFATIPRHRDILEQAFLSLADVSPEQIAEAVGRPPHAWGVRMEERIALCQFLRQRQTDLLRMGVR